MRYLFCLKSWDKCQDNLWNQKKIAVKGPSNDFSVIIPLLTSFSENEEPLKDATYSSFFSWIDKKTGSIINKKIIKQPVIIVIDVLNFIIDIINKLII